MAAVIAELAGATVDHVHISGEDRRHNSDREYLHA
jgi:uncharacterized protein (DUF849 family)